MIRNVGVKLRLSLVRSKQQVKVRVILNLSPTEVDHLSVSELRDFFLDETFKLDAPVVTHVFNQDKLTKVNTNL